MRARASGRLPGRSTTIAARSAERLTTPVPPRYTLQAPRRRPILGPFIPVIGRWLEEDQQRPTKQRHTARRVYARLVSEFGFRGGESTVRQYVREQRPRREVMIPLEHDPGEAQADWGEAQVYLDGRQTKVQLFCLRLCYSKRPFVMAFLRQSQEAFFAGHVAAFEELGGVPRMITYDNLSLAVKKVLTGSRREEQREFIAFRSHYLFESNFCRIASPECCKSWRVAPAVDAILRRQGYFRPIDLALDPEAL